MKNAHITPGGEIEKRLAFVQAFDVAGTLSKSLMRVGPIVYVVVSGAAAADQVYGDVTLRQIQAAGVSGELVDWDVFDGRLYFTTAAGGTVSHWYQSAAGSKLANAVAGGKGTYLRTYQSKMYSCEGPNIYFSTVGDPTDWATTAEGAGFINASTNDAEALDLQGIEVYYEQLAFFSIRAVQLWNMDPDPAKNSQSQTIRSIGVAGRATPRQYGSGDVLFLAPSGIRSLQARDSSNAASVSDVGSPIDGPIQAKIAANLSGILANTRTLLEELTGRFWMMFSDEIWVLSLFPGPKVSAWSRYMPTFAGGTAFTPEELVDAAGCVCVRSNSAKIYVLGGSNRTTYDACEVEVQTSYLDLGKPIVWKQLRAFDAALDGTWGVEASYNPDAVAWEPIATLTRSSYNDQSIPVQGMTPAISLRLKSTSASRARLANLAVHYNLSKDD